MNRSLHPDDALDTLGKRLRHARTNAGFKMGAMAASIGISRTSLNQWESGAVRKPDTFKLGEFSKLCDVNLDWLLTGETAEQELASSARRSIAKRREPARDGSANDMPKVGTVLPEVAAPLTAHAKGWDMNPRAHWSIPEQILELGFNAQPATCIMMRVLTREGSEFGLDRGDYVLIDTSRTVINEPGIYILADPSGLTARRALLTKDEGRLNIRLIADDDKISPPVDSGDNPMVLGRVMGIFKPT